MDADSRSAAVEMYRIGRYSWHNAVHPEMELVEQRLRTGPEGQHEWLGAATDHLLGAGGKRIRPAVSLLACGMFQVEVDAAVSLAAGVEMLHTATLVHDDLIDGAARRRGQATLNAVLGGDAAVLVGDYLFARAANLVAATDHVRVMDEFAKTLMVILNGEAAQRFSRWESGRDPYTDRIYAKTAALFVLAAQAAALLGNAADPQREAMIAYGRSIGMAFQIVDDILDYTGDAARLGKPAGGDLRQGLITLPLICFQEAHPDDEDLLEMFSLRDGSHAGLSRVIEKVRRSGAIHAALAEARAYIDTAYAALKVLPQSTYTRDLADLAASVIDRDL